MTLIMTEHDWKFTYVHVSLEESKSLCYLIFKEDTKINSNNKNARNSQLVKLRFDTLVKNCFSSYALLNLSGIEKCKSDFAGYWCPQLTYLLMYFQCRTNYLHSLIFIVDSDTFPIKMIFDSDISHQIRIYNKHLSHPSFFL